MGKSLDGKDIGKGFSQRKDGRYEARCSINGTKIDLYDSNLQNLKKRFKAEKEKVSKNGRAVNHDITLSQWFDKWFEQCKAPSLKNEVSATVYKRKIKNTFIKELGDFKLSSILQIDIQMAANKFIKEGKRPKSIKDASNVLSQCFQNAIINGLTSVNPCIDICIKNDNIVEDRRVLTKDEQKTFLRFAKEDIYYEAYKFLLLTGVRIGEFAALRWEDIDFGSKRINVKRSMLTSYINKKKVQTVTSPKTENSYRQIPFFGDIESVLRQWEEKQRRFRQKQGCSWRADPEHGNLVFTNTLGSPVTRYVIAPKINKIVKTINMHEIVTAQEENRIPVEFKPLHPHAFRHTFATRCHESHLDPLLIQKIMGHANYATTISYTHILDRFEKEELAKMNNIF